MTRVRVSQDTSFIIDNYVYETFQVSDIIYIIAEEYDLDLDELIDMCQEKGLSIPTVLNTAVENYISKLNHYELNKLFYQFVHKQKQSLFGLARVITDEKFHDLTLSTVTNHISYKRYFHNFKHMYLYLAKKLSYSFSNIIANEKSKHEVRMRNARLAAQATKYYNSRSYGSFYSTHINNMYTDDSVGTYRITRTGTSATQNWESLLGSYYNADSYNALSYYNDNDINDNVVTYYSRQIESAYRNQINESLERTRRQHDSELASLRKLYPAKPQYEEEVYKRFKRSFVSLTKFLRPDEYKALFNDNNLWVEGKVYDFNISFKNKKSILEYTKNMENYSIPYNLDLYTKQGDKLCEICIVYPGVPILDEILSTLLLIKSGQEDIILTTGNHFKKTEMYKIVFHDYDEDSLSGVAALVSEEMQERMEKLTFVTDIIKSNLSSIVGREICEYIYGLFNSWKEIVIEETYIPNVFEHMIKPLVWQKSESKRLVGGLGNVYALPKTKPRQIVYDSSRMI